MRKNPLSWLAWLLSINAVLVVVAFGCKSPDEQSFNQVFNQNMPVEPKYSIEDLGQDHFKIRIRQSSPMKGPSRVTYLKQATTIVAESESHRRGWDNWKTDYIQETDDGWMHVLVAEVSRENGVRMNPPANPP
jgi:hypothetical protein